MNISEFYEFLPFLLLTEVGYLLIVYLYWRLIHRHMSTQANGLVYGLIAIQFFLIFMHAWTFNWADIRSQRDWDLNWERNIPTTFSMIQMALAGAVAITLGWMADLPRIRRVYLLVLGAAFILFAYDEYYLLHERYQFVRNFYVLFGIFIVSLSMWLASRASSRHQFFFNLYTWVAGGIAISGFGAFTLEALSFICLQQFGLETSYCLRPYPLEEALEKLGTLIVLLGLFIEMKRVATCEKAKHVMVSGLCSLVIFLYFLTSSDGFRGFTFHSNSRALQEIPQVEVEFDDGAQLLLALKGWSLDGEAPSILEPRISLYITSLIPLKQNFGYSFLLLDAVNQEVVSSYNHWIKTPQQLWRPHRVIRESNQPWKLETLPANHAHLLTLAIWKQVEADEFINIPPSESDLQRLGATQVILGEFVVPSITQNPELSDPLAFRFGDDFVLRSVEIPKSAKAGETLSIQMSWQAINDSTEDWTQFLHFVHEETGELWNHDQKPLGSRLPTRLWYQGLQDTETWQFSLPDDILPGRYAIYTGLYRLSDWARVPVRDAAGVPLTEARAPLGYLSITTP